ncbi:MAG: hypothetical protein KDE27_18205 [Planctomycetes bacterium]|nr:hypothetical protein [Planctomycetota bacterium]
MATVRLLAVAALALPAVALITQIAPAALLLRDAVVPAPHHTAFDTERGRLVRLGRAGETRELDGATWLVRPGPGPRFEAGALVHRWSRGLTLAFGGGQTFEFDGRTWERRTPASSPPAKRLFACAYDLLRDRVVLFGGVEVSGLAGDTWEWDGVTWTQRTTTGPPARRDAGFAFDLARGRAVLFGGMGLLGVLLGDTWEWDGTLWTQTAPANPPAPRTGPAVGYDPTRARIVMHGGLDLSGSTGVAADVFEYDGVTWQLVPTAGTGPGARFDHDLLFDDRRGELLAVGGEDAVTHQRDIYSWNGTRWLLAAPVPRQADAVYGSRAVAEPLQGGALLYAGSTWRWSNGSWTLLPTPSFGLRVNPAMWSDGSNAFLFGGNDLLGGWVSQDMRRWNGTDWQLVLPATPPPSRTNAAVAYDAARGEAVLFGGRSAAAALDDTWVYDGTNWQQRLVAVRPPARSTHGMAFDPIRARLVLFGGATASSASGARNDTWEWNGSAWSQVNPPTRPPAYGAAALAFDPRSARTVLTTAPSSGSVAPTPVEVWTFDGASWTALPIHEQRVATFVHSLVQPAGGASLFLFDGSSAQELLLAAPVLEDVGSACSPAAPRLSARSWPEVGGSEFGVEVLAAPPAGACLLAIGVGNAATPVGSCTLYLGQVVTQALLPANTAGFCSHPVPIPPQAALVGVELRFQAGVLQSGPPGFTLSAGLRIVVGG